MSIIGTAKQQWGKNQVPFTFLLIYVSLHLINLGYTGIKTYQDDVINSKILNIINTPGWGYEIEAYSCGVKRTDPEEEADPDAIKTNCILDRTVDEFSATGDYTTFPLYNTSDRYIKVVVNDKQEEVTINRIRRILSAVNTEPLKGVIDFNISLREEWEEMFTVTDTRGDKIKSELQKLELPAYIFEYKILNIFSGLLFGLLLTGVVVFLSGSGLEIWGRILIIFSLLGLLGINISIYKKSENSSRYGIACGRIPMYLNICSLIGFTIPPLIKFYLNYKSKKTDGNVVETVE